MSLIQRFNLYRRRYPIINDFLKFGTVGASGFLVDVSVYYLLQWLFGIPHLTARGLSFWFSASWNWYWNRNFTFKHRQHGRKVTQWVGYLITGGVGFGLNWGTYYLLVTYVEFFDQYKLLALIAGVGAGMMFNFVSARTLIFRSI